MNTYLSVGYMTEFMFASSNLHVVPIRKSKKKNSSSNFTSPCLRRIKVSNFSSGWVQYRAKRETGDIGDVTSIQDR